MPLIIFVSILKWFLIVAHLSAPAKKVTFFRGSMSFVRVPPYESGVFFYWPSGSGQPLAPTCRLTVCTLSVIHGLAYFLPLLWVLSRFTALLHILLLLVQVSSWLEIRLGLPKLLTLQRCQPFGGVSASQVHQKPDVEQLAS